MAADRRERLTPLYGVVFVVLTVISIVLSLEGSPEDFPGNIDEIVTYYEENHGRLMASSWVGLIGAFFNLLFLGVLFDRLRAAEGPGRRLSVTAFGGGLAAVVVGLLIDTLNAAAALRTEEDDTISAETATVLYDVGSLLVGAALPVALSVLVAATGVLALRTGVLPR